MSFYFPAKNLSHSEGTWLCDCILRNEINTILRGPDYVLKLSSQKSIPFWGELTVWLYPKECNVTHSEGTWLCGYTFQPKTYPILRDVTMWLYFLAKNLSHFEGTWLCDCVLSNEIFDILRGPDYVIILSS